MRMAPQTGEKPRTIPRAVWLTLRARNAVRRPIFIGAVGIGTFVVALVALVLAPQQVTHASKVSLAALGARPDTAPILAGLAQAKARLSDAESSLAVARVRVTTAPPPTIDTLIPILISQRDSVCDAVNDLDALITRVETAPVSASYRALAESPQLAANAHAKALVDSLADVERDRDEYGATGGADPVFVALTSRAAQIGRTIQALAQQRRDELRLQIAKLNAPTQRQALVEAPALDTAGWVAERDSARSLLADATTALADARSKASDYDRAVERLHEQARLNAPPVALLAAALVLGIALGFGSAFLDELRHPRVSGDEHEVERLTGARVIATTAPRPKDPNRQRRAADRNAPRYFDPSADGYQLTYLHVARTGASRLMLTIAAADSGVAAVIGMNVAAIAADEARSAIIIDTDARTAPVAAAFRTRAEPGVVDMLRHHVDWAEVTTQAAAGRDRVVDVIPSGISGADLDPAAVTSMFRQEAARLARHYEAIVVVSTIEQAAAGLPGAFPIPDAVICARVGHTRISDLTRAIDRIRAAGGNPLGLILWDSVPPALPTPDRIARAPRPLQTEEMRALTSTTR
jgi:Mrp family chromosome partitioning ATPase